MENETTTSMNKMTWEELVDAGQANRKVWVVWRDETWISTGSITMRGNGHFTPTTGSPMRIAKRGSNNPSRSPPPSGTLAHDLT